MEAQYELQVGDIIEEFNCTGSSNRETTKTYEIVEVTKTLAKSSNGFRFKRLTEKWSDEIAVKKLEMNKWSVLAHRLQKK